MFNLFSAASERVNNELAMVKSAIKRRDDGKYSVFFVYNVFVESKRDFKKFFPWYLREIKAGYAWFKKYSQEIYNNLIYISGEEGKCDSGESKKLAS